MGLHPPRPVTPTAILAETLQRVAAQLEGVQLDPSLRADITRACALAAGLDPYLSSCTTPESPALQTLSARTRAADWSEYDTDGLEQEMLSGHVEGQVLKLLVHATRAERVLEVGMFTGYSALAMAEALPEHGELVACEIDAGVAEFARSCFDASPAGQRIRIVVGPGNDALARLTAEGAVFDLVFLDADKPGYLGYVTQILDGGLLSAHGLLCVDNTLLQGQAYLPEAAGDNGRAIAAFNRALAADARVEQVLIPLRDGLTLVRRVEP